MMSKLEKGGFPLEGINLALCENPLPPIEEAVDAAKKELELCNHYSEPYSWKLAEKISNYVNIPAENIHINAGSELILRQLFSLYGLKVHLILPTYYLFEEIGGGKTYTYLSEKDNFVFDMKTLSIPKNTTLAVIINPNNPTGTIFDIHENLSLIEENPQTIFLIDEAFIEFTSRSAVDLISKYKNVIVTRTFSKAFSLAGMRTGYAISNVKLINSLKKQNDAYPLGRAAEAAAIASLENIDKIKNRVTNLRNLAKQLANSLEELGVKTFPSETYFFVIKIPQMQADEFVDLLAKRNIHARTLDIPRLENKFVRFTTSTEENNKTIIDAVSDILKNKR